VWLVAGVVVVVVAPWSARPYTPASGSIREIRPAPTNTMSFTTAVPDEMVAAQVECSEQRTVAASKARSWFALSAREDDPGRDRSGPEAGHVAPPSSGNCQATAPFVSSRAKMKAVR